MHFKQEDAPTFSYVTQRISLVGCVQISISSCNRRVIHISSVSSVKAIDNHHLKFGKAEIYLLYEFIR